MTVITTYPSVNSGRFIISTGRKSSIDQFMHWTKHEEKNHIAWMGISVTIMSAVLFPLTMAVILFNGHVFGLIITAMAALCLVVITNLAALPTKYSIPAFIIGILIDLAVIAASFIIK